MAGVILKAQRLKSNTTQARKCKSSLERGIPSPEMRTKIIQLFELRDRVMGIIRM